MTIYTDQLLGAPATDRNGKDRVLSFRTTGTLDVYEETLVGGVDYTIAAFGRENGGTLRDPAVLVFDSEGTVINVQLDSAAAGFNSLDPFFFFRPPGLGVGRTSTYYIGVYDEADLGGEYTLSVEGAGEPVSFGSIPLGGL